MDEFAISRDGRDLRGRIDALKGLGIQLNLDGPYKRAASSDNLDALKPGLSYHRRPHLDSIDELRRDWACLPEAQRTDDCKVESVEYRSNEE